MLILETFAIGAFIYYCSTQVPPKPIDGTFQNKTLQTLHVDRHFPAVSTLAKQVFSTLSKIRKYL